MRGIKLITFFLTPSSKRYPPHILLQNCQGLHKDCWKEALDYYSTYYNLARTTKNFLGVREPFLIRSTFVEQDGKQQTNTIFLLITNWRLQYMNLFMHVLSLIEKCAINFRMICYLKSLALQKQHVPSIGASSNGRLGCEKTEGSRDKDFRFLKANSRCCKSHT